MTIMEQHDQTLMEKEIDKYFATLNKISEEGSEIWRVHKHVDACKALFLAGFNHGKRQDEANDILNSIK